MTSQTSAAELESNTPTLDLDKRLIAGRYLPQERIGSGRLGEIFTAIDEEFDIEQHLAIQILPENIVRNNKLFNKLNVGYSILKAANHPNIVKYLHIGRHGKRGFLVMERLDGASLRSILDTADTLPTDEAKPVIRGIGEALEMLHAEDMLHGNLTTANVFITTGLEVVLLDVLPLGAEQAVISGGTMGSPFSRCTARGDVLGLACLAYEMLAGRRPFGDNPPTASGSADLEAERIESLNDAEWNALRLALSSDHENRTASVADFLRDFGVRRSERLQPVAGEPTRREIASSPATVEVSTGPELPVPELPVPEQVTEPALEPVTAAVFVEKESPDPRRQKGKVGGRRAVLLALLLTVLGAWTWLGLPREQVADMISQVDAIVAIGRPARAIDSASADPDRPQATDRIAAVDTMTTPAPIADVAVTPEQPDVSAPEPEFVAADATMPSATERPADIMTPAGPPAEERTTAEEATNVATDLSSAESSDDLAPADPVAAVVQPVITVSERDGAARIVAPATGYSESPLVWWTSDDSAIADKDFIAVAQTLVTGAGIDDGNILHVPLVNDSLPEPPESFFVSFGFRDLQSNHIERVATVRVNIVDDD